MNVEAFLGHLYDALDADWTTVPNPPGRDGDYSRYIFPVLARAARDAGLDPRWKHEGRELLYDMVWLPRNGGTFRMPEVVIEHENLTHPLDFLVDLRKLLVAWAPLRVMIGYVPREHDPEERLETLRQAAKEGHWTYPNDCADLALVGPYKMHTPRDYLVLHRPAGTREFVERRRLSSYAPLAQTSSPLCNV